MTPLLPLNEQTLDKLRSAWSLIARGNIMPLCVRCRSRGGDQFMVNWPGTAPLFHCGKLLGSLPLFTPEFGIKGF